MLRRMHLLFLCTLFLGMLFQSSCTIEKRKFLKGYYISSAGNPEKPKSVKQRAMESVSMKEVMREEGSSPGKVSELTASVDETDGLFAVEEVGLLNKPYPESDGQNTESKGISRKIPWELTYPEYGDERQEREKTKNSAYWISGAVVVIIAAGLLLIILNNPAWAGPIVLLLLLATILMLKGKY